jgi:hypothetical protein
MSYSIGLNYQFNTENGSDNWHWLCLGYFSISPFSNICTIKFGDDFVRFYLFIPNSGKKWHHVDGDFFLCSFHA